MQPAAVSVRSSGARALLTRSPWRRGTTAPPPGGPRRRRRRSASELFLETSRRSGQKDVCQISRGNFPSFPEILRSRQPPKTLGEWLRPHARMAGG